VKGQKVNWWYSLVNKHNKEQGKQPDTYIVLKNVGTHGSMI